MMTQALFAVWCALAAADAEELAARAHKAEAALDYEEAARFWLEVLALEELPDHRRVEAHLQLATAFVILDDKEGARFHFRRGLTLEPTADLAPHAPAKARVVFEDVKGELRMSATEQLDQGPWLAGTVALTAGSVLGVTSAILFVMGALADSEALDEDTQIERVALYDRRDALIIGGDVAAVGAGALMLVAGGAFALVGWGAITGE